MDFVWNFGSKVLQSMNLFRLHYIMAFNSSCWNFRNFNLHEIFCADTFLMYILFMKLTMQFAHLMDFIKTDETLDSLLWRYQSNLHYDNFWINWCALRALGLILHLFFPPVWWIYLAWYMSCIWVLVYMP